MAGSTMPWLRDQESQVRGEKASAHLFLVFWIADVVRLAASAPRCLDPLTVMDWKCKLK